jgi:hypothetical protein
MIPALAYAQWDIQIVDNSGITGKFTSIAYDSDGYPHIVYFNYTDNRILHAHWTGDGGWSIQELGSNATYTTTGLAIDQFSHCHSVWVSSSSYNNLWYHYQSPTGTWVKESAYQGASNIYIYFPSLALSYDDGYQKIVPHVAVSINQRLYYGWKNPDTDQWSFQNIDAAASVAWTSIAIDSNNRMYIAYYDATDQDLKYAYFNGSQWSTFIVDYIGAVGNYCSIALDASDVPHIAYYDATNGDLKHATVIMP